jgi:SAM-dependent methyltransferase
MAAPNPWLEIPLADYEGHVALPEVGQAAFLADALERLARQHAPQSVAVIGCAGGNGFSRLAALNIPRVVGIDLNPAYLAEAERRHAGSFPKLELICCDIASAECQIEPVDFAFAGLIFEYADTVASLRSIRRMLRPGAALAAFLQLPHPDIAAVTPSPFTSLTKLAPLMRLVPPARFHEAAGQAGFNLRSSLRRLLPSGKCFQEILITAC